MKFVLKILVGLMLTGFLTFTLASSNQVFTVTEDHIEIWPDGTVFPDDVPIRRDGKTYTFTDDIHLPIVVFCSDILIDGAGHILEGTGSEIGINCYSAIGGIQNVTIADMSIKIFSIGIRLWGCTLFNISVNITICFDTGLLILDSESISIIGCMFSSCTRAVSVDSTSNSLSSHMIFAENVITTSQSGIVCNGTSYANFTRNTLIDRSISLYRTYNSTLFENQARIECDHSDNNAITANKRGVVLTNATRNNVVGNEGGIDIGDSSNNNIVGNEGGQSLSDSYLNKVVRNRGSIRLWNSSYNDIRENTFANITEEGNDFGCLLIWGSSYNNITNNIVKNNTYGIYLWGVVDGISQNIIDGNEIRNNSRGIALDQNVTHNTIKGNNILSNDKGIDLGPNYGVDLMVSSNVFHENTIADNKYGIHFGGEDTYGNVFFNNDFVNNEIHSFAESPAYLAANSWDHGQLDGGNYWSEYEGEDRNGDGFGDTLTPYREDRYPLIVPRRPISVRSPIEQETYNCTIIGNVTVCRFSLDQTKTLGFKINGQGYVNFTIPRKMLDGSFKIFIDETQVPYSAMWNTTYSYVCFEYSTSVPVSVRVEAQFKLAGDLNSDGEVNILDLAIAAKCFGKKLPRP